MPKTFKNGLYGAGVDLRRAQDDAEVMEWLVRRAVGLQNAARDLFDLFEQVDGLHDLSRGTRPANVFQTRPLHQRE